LLLSNARRSLLVCHREVQLQDIGAGLCNSQLSEQGVPLCMLVSGALVFAPSKTGKRTTRRLQSNTEVPSVWVKAALTRRAPMCLARRNVIVHNLQYKSFLSCITPDTQQQLVYITQMPDFWFLLTLTTLHLSHAESNSKVVYWVSIV